LLLTTRAQAHPYHFTADSVWYFPTAAGEHLTQGLLHQADNLLRAGRRVQAKMPTRRAGQRHRPSASWS